MSKLLALYFYQVGFRFSELVLLMAIPLFFYILPMENNLMNIPVIEVGNKLIGFNVIGLLIPLIVSAKILMQKRLPLREVALITTIVATVTYLYTNFDPDVGIIIYFFAIPPMLAAAIAFILKKDPRVNDYNTALMTYVCATLGILIGADVLYLYHILQWWRPDGAVFIIIGGAGVTDGIFLAGIIAVLFDLIFTCQEHNVVKDFVRMLKQD
ncbi:MAG: DUF1614 domain-containing protein [Methanosarcinales archaeon Met12]|nr:MAG: DUF1614 domain-containing protein [Methanosarcinales archaeon Met12]